MATTFNLGRLRTAANRPDYVVRPKPVVPQVSLLDALRNYIDLALAHAQTEYLDDDRKYYSEIPGFAGVYATGDTADASVRELREVLEEWIALRLERGRSLPAADPA